MRTHPAEPESPKSATPYRGCCLIPLTVQPELVEEAIAWLDERWHGEPFVPDELLPLVSAA